MPTREEIREWIRRIIKNDYVFLPDEKVYLDECSEDILIYLHSQGLRLPNGEPLIKEE